MKAGRAINHKPKDKAEKNKKIPPGIDNLDNSRGKDNGQRLVAPAVVKKVVFPLRRKLRG